MFTYDEIKLNLIILLNYFSAQQRHLREFCFRRHRLYPGSEKDPQKSSSAAPGHNFK